MLKEEAVKLYFLGVQVYGWGLYIFFGALLCLMVMVFLCRRSRMQKGFAVFSMIMMLISGFVFSRLFYCVFDSLMRMVLSWHGLFAVTGGGYSMFGALAGAVIGVWLAAGITGADTRKALDIAACALLLFVAAARLGEGMLTESNFGRSRALYGENALFSFLITKGDYNDYLSTYLLESFYAVLCFVIGIRRYASDAKKGNTALMLLLLFGAGQTLFESLRYDSHMRAGFVGFQHIMAYTCMAAACFVIAMRVIRGKKGVKKDKARTAAVLLICSLPIVLGLLILIEFMIDRSAVSNLVLYIVYILLLAAPAVTALKLHAPQKGD